MKAGGRYNIDNKSEAVISGFDYAASSLSYLFEDVASPSGGLAAVLPVLEEGLSRIYDCEFDVLHVSTAVASLTEFFTNYLGRRAPETQRVGRPTVDGFARSRDRNSRASIRSALRERRPYGDDDEMGGGMKKASPFTLKFSQNGGFVFEPATPDDFVVQVILKQKGAANYGQFLLNNLIASGNSFFADIETVDDMKLLMAQMPDDFNKNLGKALEDSFAEAFTNLYIDVSEANGNQSVRLLNISVDWQQDRTTVTADVGVYIQDFRL